MNSSLKRLVARSFHEYGGCLFSERMMLESPCDCTARLPSRNVG